ncbi:MULTISPECIES: secretion protein HlyD [unclassified Chelatococcus]|uniref:secretion protein HlyD n=1 Tax=unclassified Chelatococcus TaxID=2638111 RepID=UPI00030ADB07|nr:MULTISPECIES: secretion protein HlyD [unclassified Chelatococcus]ALA19989.1 secretion protein HlyD [Chelatococcus sp. CO-6]
MSGSRGRKAAILLALALAVAAAGWWFDLPGRFGWREDRNEALTLYGNVDIRQARLGFRVGGRIAEALVDEGDRVAAGQLLARLDAGPAEDAVRAAEAQVASLEAVLEKLVAGPRPAEIEQARAAHVERQADLENAELAFERQNQLRPSGAASQANLDQATAARDMARARVESARAALRLLEDGTRPEDIAAARANLDAARASLAAARTGLADTELRAPSAGVILSRVEEPGAIVASGDVVYVLSLEAPVFVRAYVGEPDLGRIRPGMTVEVTNDTEPGRAHRGTVGFVSPVAEFTPKSVETPALRTDLVYRLRIVVDAPDGSLRQGMPVTVRVPRPAAEAGGG